MPFQGRVEDSFDQARLAAAGNTRYNGHHVEWDCHVDASQVIHPGTLDVNMQVPGSPALWYRNLLLMKQVFHRMAHWPLFYRSVGHNLSPESSSIWSYVYQMIRSSHDFLVMFHHYHRITQRLEVFQYVYQPVCISRMQAYRRLVEDIQRTYKTASQRGTQIDTLALAATERIRKAVESQIAQSHI